MASVKSTHALDPKRLDEKEKCSLAERVAAVVSFIRASHFRSTHAQLGYGYCGEEGIAMDTPTRKWLTS